MQLNKIHIYGFDEQITPQAEFHSCMYMQQECNLIMADKSQVAS